MVRANLSTTEPSWIDSFSNLTFSPVTLPMAEGYCEIKIMKMELYNGNGLYSLIIPAENYVPMLQDYVNNSRSLIAPRVNVLLYQFNTQYEVFVTATAILSLNFMYKADIMKSAQSEDDTIVLQFRDFMKNKI